MPVTARLLQRLQETLGDEAMADLLAWLDESARGQRAGVREVADLYYHRFDTRLEDGLSALRTEFTARLDAGLASVRSELTARLEAGLASLHTEFTARLDAGLTSLRSELIARLETGLAAQRAELLKWMFVFWVGTIVPLAGLILALHRA